jgi:hypothetical protein
LDIPRLTILSQLKEPQVAQVHKSKLIFLLDEVKVRVVGVSYEDNDRAPHVPYKTMDTTLQVGDYVVVPTDTRWKMTVCRVEEINVEPDLDMTEIHWLRAVVDQSDYSDILVGETQLIAAANSAEKRALKAKLRAEMTIDQEAMSGLTLLGKTSDPKRKGSVYDDYEF